MVPLPLFKVAALFLRHISKYGANQIKHRAHTHPRVRKFAAKCGQGMHQLQMRLSVSLLRNAEAEQRAKELAEAPTVKTKEQIEKEEDIKAKYGTTAKEARQTQEAPRSVWRRKFRSLPEAKAVELFADVAGDAFILFVAIGLIVYEYWRSANKPDANLERIKELDQRLEELRLKEEALEEAEKRAQTRVQTIEEALRTLRDPKTKQPLLPAATPSL